MKKKVKKTFYNYQFKHTAVTITEHPNIQASDVAAALQIHPIMLYRWRGELREGQMEDNDQEARSINELTEAKKKIAQLERENKKLRSENTVLKKAERLFPEKK